MLQDTSAMNPKGRLRFELYDEDGVFYTEEKDNLVVTSASEIVAKMISDPAKMSRITQTDNGETEAVANDEGYFVFNLSVQPKVVQTITQDVVSVNEETIFEIEEMKEVDKLISVKVGEEELVIDQDVFLKDAETGVLEFASAPKEMFEVTFLAVNNKQTKIVAGTEKVFVNGVEWTKGLIPNASNRIYAIDYETGEVKFQRITENITVTYECMKHYGLGFMALGGKPEGHPDHQPVSFSNIDKALTRMDAEFEESRMPIIYPATIEEEKPELEVLPTKPVAFEEKEVIIVAADDNLDEEIDKEYKVDDSGKRLLELVSAKKLADPEDDEAEDVELVIGEDIIIKDANNAIVEFIETPEEGDKFEVVFKLQQNNLHLNYQLAITPVVELVSVVHEDAVTNEITAYEIKEQGMRIGSGDVWLMNPNAGILQFSSNPSNGVPIHTPGQITVQYRVNAGKTVKFVADFPKGVPGPVKLEQTDTFTSTGETTFALSKTVAKDTDSQFEVISVTRNGNPETFSIHADGKRIDIDNVSSGDIVVVTYKFLEDAHDVYQVAMFDEKDSANSKMFNIAGIGPVRKDKDTGMRITWSVTF